MYFETWQNYCSVRYVFRQPGLSYAKQIESSSISSSKNSISKQEWGDHLVQASGEIKSDNFYKNIFQNKTRDIHVKISKFFN